MNVSGVLGGVTLRPFTVPFLEQPIEQVTDVVTLDGTMYTDFISLRRGLELNWFVLTEEEYADLREIYQSQFSTATYPEFTCEYLSINDTPVRMYINDRDIRKDGCLIYGVQVKLIQKYPLSSSTDWITTDSGEPILI